MSRCSIVQPATSIRSNDKHSSIYIACPATIVLINLSCPGTSIKIICLSNLNHKCKTEFYGDSRFFLRVSVSFPPRLNECRFSVIYMAGCAYNTWSSSTSGIIHHTSNDAVEHHNRGSAKYIAIHTASLISLRIPIARALFKGFTQGSHLDRSESDIAISSLCEVAQHRAC